MVRESKLFQKVSNFFILTWAKTKSFFKLRFNKQYRERMELESIKFLWEVNDPNYREVEYFPNITYMSDIQNYILSSSGSYKDDQKCTSFKWADGREIQQKHDVYYSSSDCLEINIKSYDGLDQESIDLLKYLEKIYSVKFNITEDKDE